MATQPGIAFVTGASCDLGGDTALDLADPQHERADAARNRALLLDAARRLIAACGPDTVTMDEIATAAGVGKGTLFRRFGSRAGLMIVLLDEDEQAEQQAFLFGPAPLGPSAPPLERLLAYGRARLRFVHPSHAAQRYRPRSAVPVQRAGHVAPQPHTRAAGGRGHHRPPRHADRSVAGSAAGRLRRTPDQRARPDPGGARRRLGKLGAQAVRTVTRIWILHVDPDQFLASVERGSASARTSTTGSRAPR
jgi:AcrR family transcriptional regulator